MSCRLDPRVFLLSTSKILKIFCAQRKIQNFFDRNQTHQHIEQMQDNRCVLIKRLKRVHNNSIVKFRVLAYVDGRIKVDAVQQNDTSRRFKKTFSKGEVRERLLHLSYTWTDFDTSDDNTVKVVCTRRGKDFLKLLAGCLT